MNLVGHVECSSIADDIYTSISKKFIEKELKKYNKNIYCLTIPLLLIKINSETYYYQYIQSFI